MTPDGMTRYGLAVGRTGPDLRRRPAVDAAVIDQLASITDGQGRSVLRELLQAFLAAVPARLDALDAAVAAADLPGVAHGAHSLTGSSLSFGATGMASLCRALRAAADAGGLDGAPALMTRLWAEHMQVRAELERLLGRAA